MSQLSLSQPDAFPVEVLPPRVLLFVEEAAVALGVDPALIAGPCLAALAGCIGNRRRIVLRPGWSEACVLWIAIVMPSGSKKSPAIKRATGYLADLEAAALAEYAEIMEKWKGGPQEPERPNRLIVSDITTEGLLSVHSKAPLGLLLYRDELAGWFNGFDRYNSGKGGDAQTWAEMHQGTPCIIDRKTSGTLSVPRAAVSIVGGIQPEILRKALTGDHLYDGIASRVLFIAVPERLKKWDEEESRDDTRMGWTSLLDELLALRPNEDGTPVDLPMTERAKAAWASYYNEHAQREAKEHGPMRAAMSKLEATTARFALVIQLAKNPRSVEVYAKAMKAGIVLSNWFEGQARRVYRGFEETEQERDRREVYAWIMKHGRSTTERDLANGGPNRFRKRAREVLADLVAAGSAERFPQPGKKGDVYTLCDSDSCDGETP